MVSTRAGPDRLRHPRRGEANDAGRGRAKILARVSVDVIGDHAVVGRQRLVGLAASLQRSGGVDRARDPAPVRRLVHSDRDADRGQDGQERDGEPDPACHRAELLAGDEVVAPVAGGDHAVRGQRQQRHPQGRDAVRGHVRAVASRVAPPDQGQPEAVPGEQGRRAGDRLRAVEGRAREAAQVAAPCRHLLEQLPSAVALSPAPQPPAVHQIGEALEIERGCARLSRRISAGGSQLDRAPEELARRAGVEAGGEQRRRVGVTLGQELAHALAILLVGQRVQHIVQPGAAGLE